MKRFCVACKHFPWKPEADLERLPSMACHPEVEARRWTELSEACKRFARRKDAPVEEVQVEEVEAEEVEAEEVEEK